MDTITFLGAVAEAYARQDVDLSENCLGSRLGGAPRVTQLMELYMAYRELRKVSDPIDDEKTLVDFDEFLPWGEVVLSDFSEVDICDVDAQKIFANVVNYRTLGTWLSSHGRRERAFLDQRREGTGQCRHEPVHRAVAVAAGSIHRTAQTAGASGRRP